MSRRQRDLVVPVAAFVVVLGVVAVAAGRLPDVVAVRFGALGPAASVVGQPVGFLARWGLLVVAPVLALGPVVLAARLSGWVHTRRAASRVFAGVNGMAVEVAALLGVVVGANVGVADPVAARLPSVFGWWPWVEAHSTPGTFFDLVLLGAASLTVGSGLAVVASGRARPASLPPLVTQRPPRLQSPDVVWTGRSRLSPIAWLLGSGALYPMAFVGLLGDGYLAVIYVSVLGVNLLVPLRHLWCDVTVGPGGIRVRTRPLGTRWFLPWGDVRAVELVDVEVQDRPVRTHLGRHAILRSGPALRIVLGDTSALVVTVDDAGTGAAIANVHLESARAVAAQTR